MDKKCNLGTVCFSSKVYIREKKRKSVVNPFEYYHWAFESRLVTVHQEKAVVM